MSSGSQLIKPISQGSTLEADVVATLLLAVVLCSVSSGITKNVHSANNTSIKTRALSIVTGKFIDGSTDVRHFVQTDSIPTMETLVTDDISGKRMHQQQRSIYGYLIETNKNKGTVIVKERVNDLQKPVTLILSVDSSKCALRTWTVSSEQPGQQRVLKVSVNGQPEKTLKWNFVRANKTSD